ncbi:hypothetical protein [Sphaerisporangium dianthi]|uniref:Uncharacterized protein n=1 Tax=Sphaerisporangium dianthi TaxID=1436120 RepID=A0ABV9CM26_9ACTN
MTETSPRRGDAPDDEMNTRAEASRPGGNGAKPPGGHVVHDPGDPEYGPGGRGEGGGDEGAPPPIRAEDIVLPCHHGCACGLHQQVVYGSLVDPHSPEQLDYGEMAELTEASETATRKLDAYHTYLSRQRGTVGQSRDRATGALGEFRTFLHSGAIGRARGDITRAERDLAALPAHDRGEAPQWLKILTVLTIVGVAYFDATFFQQAFLDILKIPLHAPLAERAVGWIAALVLALSLVACGRVIAGPVYRTARAARRTPSPDEPPPRRLMRASYGALLLAFPLAVLSVYGLWALLRGQLAAADATRPVTAPGWSVLLLLMVLALTVIALEVLIYRPYHENLREAERRYRTVTRQGVRLDKKAGEALTAYEHAFRDLRSCHDEVAAVIRAELARPWHTVILPARLRHGAAGQRPPRPLLSGDIATPADSAAQPEPSVRDRGPADAGPHLPDLPFRIFEGVDQPQPGRGPLAETARSIRDLDPGPVRAAYTRLSDRLEKQLAITPAPEPATLALRESASLQEEA